MNKSCSTFGIQGLFLLVCLATQIFANNNIPNDRGILYFGFFFNNQTASSLKSITDTYFDSTLSHLPEFALFLNNISASANVTDPHAYFAKPADPNSGEYDPLYHITAKYCGQNQKTCAEYERNNSKELDTKFEMNLVGYVITSRTFGIRVELTSDQKSLFDGENGKTETEQVSPEKSNKMSAPLPGELKLEQQKFPPSLPATSTRAHITLGCAPGVAAVVTGPDALQAIRYEQSGAGLGESWDNIVDPKDENSQNMRVTLYKPNATSPPSDFMFVIYPRVKVLANATLERYYQKSTGSASSSLKFIWKSYFLALLASASPKFWLRYRGFD